MARCRKWRPLLLTLGVLYKLQRISNMEKILQEYTPDTLGAREFRRGIDRVAEAMEGLGDDETLQALLHQLRTLERRPLAKVGLRCAESQSLVPPPPFQLP